ncbi:MAG: putative alpha-dextrin endo,6-alpha-glucosidase [Flaviaesturariibacter sp.]|nr:putative alpha-dextrin endo,6-alpha-glucosidase [Flaviaesturariibacter sp.]
MAPKNVWIIDEAFYIPQLNRWRRIWLYLPPDYSNSNQPYPVLYMHDGQNLFEEWSSFGEEWQVDETIDSMAKKSIVVGIDNGLSHRLTEYNIADHPEHGRGEGKAYLAFIKDTLKPYIDNTYRTLADREHTGLAGSSMGGLISFYGGLLHKETFGKVGVFSPSFWLKPELFLELKALEINAFSDQEWYFYAGEKESEHMAETTKKIAGLVLEKGASVTQTYNREGDHSERNWREQFPHFYKWFVKEV